MAHTALPTCCLPGGQSPAYLGTMPIGRDGGDRLLTALLMLQFPQNLPGLRGRITQENGELTTTKWEIP